MESTVGGRWDTPQHQQAKALCHTCVVRARCLEYALESERDVEKRSRHGIWGGLTPEERWKLVRRM